MATNNSINANQTLSTSSSPIFSGLNLSGLTASTLVATDGSKNLSSSTSSLIPQFSKLTLGTATQSGNLTVAGAGGTTVSDILCYFGSVTAATAGNLYYNSIDKSGVEAFLWGINKNSTTGSVPSNALFISSYNSNAQISIGRGAGTGLPSNRDIGIDGSGNVSINNGNLNVANLTASSLVATDSSKNLTSSVSGLSPTFTGLNLSGLTASSLVATDGSKNLTSTVSGLSPTFTGLNLSGLTASSIVTTDGSKNLSTVSNPQTYTPTIGDGTNNFSTTTAIGQYYNLGSLYIVSGQLIWNSKGSASAGSDIRISLPASLGANNARAGVSLGFLNGVGYTGNAIVGTASTAQNYIVLWGLSTGGTPTSVKVSQAGTSGEVQFTIAFWSN